MVTDADRRDLYLQLTQALGERSADTLMAMLGPFDWSEVARRGDLDRLRAELRGDMGELRGEFGELRGEFGDLRGEVRALGSRLDAQLAKLIGANVVTLATAVGIFAAITG